MYQILLQALTAEARLLAPPVSFEMTSTSGAEGIEDRRLLGLLACRKLAAIISLGERIAAIEVLVAAQAAELRNAPPFRRGNEEPFRRIRSVIPLALDGDPVPSDVESLTSPLTGAN
jgi:histidine ammonia-lyase